jgi:hypothetical protein
VAEAAEAEAAEEAAEVEEAEASAAPLMPSDAQQFHHHQAVSIRWRSPSGCRA